MQAYEVSPKSVLPLFDGVRMPIARAMLRGTASCRVFADHPTAPRAAIVTARRIGCAFAAGDASHAPTLLAAIATLFPWIECVADGEAWHRALSGFSPKSHALMRYAMSAEALDRDAMQAMAVPPEGFELARYDRTRLAAIRALDWGEDQIGLYDDDAAFLKDSGGWIIMHGSVPVAGCAGFCRDGEGDEIQVDVHPDYRRRGLATCVCAAFMLDALTAGRIPRWDAANLASVRLAERLGFRVEAAYPAWCLLAPEADLQQALQQMGPDQ